MDTAGGDASQGPHLSRRGFLRAAGASLIGVSAAVILASGGDSPRPDFEQPQRVPIPGLRPGARVVYNTHRPKTITALLERYLELYPDEQVELVQLGGGDAVRRISDEQEEPVADVWIGSSAIDALALAQFGIVGPHATDEAAHIPEQYRDPQGRWFAIGLRPQVIAFQSGILQAAEVEPPAGMLALRERRWRSNRLRDWQGEAVLGLPDLTQPPTLAWLSWLYGVLGPEQGRSYLQTLRDMGAGIPGADTDVINALINQRYAVGVVELPPLLDRLLSGVPGLSFVYPDQASDAPLPGVWMSPTTVSRLKDDEGAHQLMNFLLSVEAAQVMVEQGFEYPARDDVEVPNSHFAPPEGLRIAPQTPRDVLLITDQVRQDVRAIWGI